MLSRFIVSFDTFIDTGKAAAAEEISKHSILDIDLTEENLPPCVFIALGAY